MCNILIWYVATSIIKACMDKPQNLYSENYFTVKRKLSRIRSIKFWQTILMSTLYSSLVCFSCTSNPICMILNLRIAVKATASKVYIYTILIDNL